MRLGVENVIHVKYCALRNGREMLLLTNVDKAYEKEPLLIPHNFHNAFKKVQDRANREYDL